MKRRHFLQNLAASAGISCLPSALRTHGVPLEESSNIAPPHEDTASLADVEGHTFLCEFQLSGKNWKVYEDLRTREGGIVFLSNVGTNRLLPKSAEAVFAETDPPYLGMNLDEIGLSGADLLADRLLQGGNDPDPAAVKSAAPPQGSNVKEHESFRLPWNTFVGTRECFDAMPVFATGRTRTYHPEQYFSEIAPELAAKRFEGLVGGWMPAVRWMVVLEDSDEDILYFGKGIPRSWLVSGKPVRIESAPTRWGRVTFELRGDTSTRHIAGKILLAAAGKPAQIQLKLRLPLQSALSGVTVNGHDAKVTGKRNDTVLISTGQQKQFDIRAQYDAS